MQRYVQSHLTPLVPHTMTLYSVSIYVGRPGVTIGWKILRS